MKGSREEHEDVPNADEEAPPVPNADALPSAATLNDVRWTFVAWIWFSHFCDFNRHYCHMFPSIIWRETTDDCFQHKTQPR